MTAIYSTRFAKGTTSTTGTTTIYTVPTGYVAVVRTVALSNAASVLVNANLLAAGVPIAAINESSGWFTQSQDMRQVLEAGDILAIQLGAGGVDYYVSGYLLTSP